MTKLDTHFNKSNQTGIISIPGTYTRSGSKLIQEGKDCIFYILKRKKTTPLKPENYIIAKLEGKDIYISSLYPIAENIYRIEYDFVIYILTMETDQCRIEKR